LFPEIQTDLIRAKEGNQIVNSMGVVSKFAYKSDYLNQVTGMFKHFDLAPIDYYIAKCRAEEKEDSKQLSMWCGECYIKLKP